MTCKFVTSSNYIIQSTEIIRLHLQRKSQYGYGWYAQKTLYVNQICVLVWIAAVSSTDDFSICYTFCVAIKRLAKGIEASIRVAPLLKSYLETQQEHQNKPHENYNFLAGIIFASVLFLGSSLMVPYNLNLAYGGFISSAITLFASTLLKKRL